MENGNAQEALQARSYTSLLHEKLALGFNEGAHFVSVAALGLLGMPAYAVEARHPHWPGTDAT